MEALFKMELILFLLLLMRKLLFFSVFQGMVDICTFIYDQYKKQRGFSKKQNNPRRRLEKFEAIC